MKRYWILLAILIFLVSGSLSYGAVTAQNGWSSNIESETKAVSEALKNIKLKSPKLVLFFATVDYKDPQAIVKGLLQKYPKAQIAGESSCVYVADNSGVHKGLTVLAVEGDLDVAVESTEISGDGLAEGKKLANTIKTKLGTPSVIWMMGTPGVEEGVLKGIMEVFGKDIKVFGGSAADNTIEGKWWIAHNDKILKKGVVLVAIKTKSKVGTAFASGYLASEYSGKVTKAKFRVIEEIDGKPAGDVYNQWLNGALTEDIKTGANILMKIALTPLAYKVGEYFISIHPEHIDPQTKAIYSFADVKEGETVYLIKGSEDILIKRPEVITKRAFLDGKLKKDEVAFAYFIYCAGTMLKIQNSISKAIDNLKDTLGDVPFIGAFTFGEQGLMPGFGLFHGNLMSDITLVGK